METQEIQKLEEIHYCVEKKVSSTLRNLYLVKLLDFMILSKLKDFLYGNIFPIWNKFPLMTENCNKCNKFVIIQETY